MAGVEIDEDSDEYQEWYHSFTRVPTAAIFEAQRKISEILNKYFEESNRSNRQKQLSTLLRNGETSRLCLWISWLRGNLTSKHSSLRQFASRRLTTKLNLYWDSRLDRVPRQHGWNDLRPAVQARVPQVQAQDINHVYWCAIGQVQLTSLVLQRVG